MEGQALEVELTDVPEEPEQDEQSGTEQAAAAAAQQQQQQASAPQQAQQAQQGKQGKPQAAGDARAPVVSLPSMRPGSLLGFVGLRGLVHWPPTAC